MTAEVHPLVQMKTTHPAGRLQRGREGVASSREIRNCLSGKMMLTGIGDVTNSQEKAHFSASMGKYWRAFLKLKITTCRAN
jgi:hypothetical protein